MRTRDIIAKPSVQGSSATCTGQQAGPATVHVPMASKLGLSAEFAYVPELSWRMWQKWTQQKPNPSNNNTLARIGCLLRMDYLRSYSEIMDEIRSPLQDVCTPPRRSYLALHSRRGDRADANQLQQLSNETCT